jgi:hypothetical protein
MHTPSSILLFWSIIHDVYETRAKWLERVDKVIDLFNTINSREDDRQTKKLYKFKVLFDQLIQIMNEITEEVETIDHDEDFANYEDV